MPVRDRDMLLEKIEEVAHEIKRDHERIAILHHRGSDRGAWPAGRIDDQGADLRTQPVHEVHGDAKEVLHREVGQLQVVPGGSIQASPEGTEEEAQASTSKDARFGPFAHLIKCE